MTEQQAQFRVGLFVIAAGVVAQLWLAGVDWQEALPPVAACTPTERKILQQQFASSFNTVPTSSMGRLCASVPVRR